MKRCAAIYARYTQLIANHSPIEKIAKFEARWSYRYHLKGREHRLNFDRVDKKYIMFE